MRGEIWPLDGALVSVGGYAIGNDRDDAWRTAFESVFLEPFASLGFSGRIWEARDKVAPELGLSQGIGGSVAFVLALSVRVPLAELAISNGLFPGLAGVVKMLAEELGPSGTRVNGILPVRIATDRVRQLDALAATPTRCVPASPRRFRYADTANPRSSGELPPSYSPRPLPTSRAR